MMIDYLDAPVQEENDQEEIDDDEDNAIAEHIEAQVRNYSNALGKYLGC